MLAATLTLFALVASANNSASLNYQADYANGYTLAIQSQKPIALFFAQGKTGPSQVITDGLSLDSIKLLNESYVAIYVDTATEAGTKLATLYGVSTGLVISDRAASKQALRINGTLTADDLQVTLVKFADPNVVITTTQTSVRPTVMATPASYAPNGYNPFSPCASGRCPNAR